MNLYGPVEAAFKRAEFRKVEGDKPVARREGLFISPGLIRKAAETAFGELAFYFRKSYLLQLIERLKSPDCPENDRFTLGFLLKNAVVAAEGVFASCQDTGTAIIYGWRPEGVFSGCSEQAELEAGVEAAYRNHHLRSSQTGASAFFEEFNADANLPAQIHLEAVPFPSGETPAYRFLFSAKGGGSSNKTVFFSQTPALLEETRFEAFLRERIAALGTAACPPYQLAVVVGGTSPEQNLEVLKLATSGLLDEVPFFEDGIKIEGSGELRRDRRWEERAMEMGRETGLGTQFGGTNLLLSARVLRLPRHAASCPVSAGVSCAAHRNILACINPEGLFLERLVRSPGALLREAGLDPDDPGGSAASGGSVPLINLDRPVRDVCRELSAWKPGARVTLSGKLLVARDRAHLLWHNLLAEGKALPDYLFRHPVYYAGPARTPPHRVSGSLGPTTAQRMDPYGEELMSRGASLVTLAKGNRTGAWRDCCKKYGGFYLGTVGGAGALLAAEHVTAGEVLDYPELGMEAVRLITVKELPAFIIMDDKGGDLYGC